MTPSCEGLCKKQGEQTPDPKLHKLIFGGYNKRIENPKTPNDWLTRDTKIVDDYNAHPLCGFVPACGLLRDMMKGICFVEQKKNLQNMKKHLPVFFIAGAEDPVGPYGKGVEQAVAEKGLLGALTGGLTATAGGITAAVLFSLIAALLVRPGDKR